jgi:hypothetical protein
MKYERVELNPTAKARFGKIETPIAKLVLPAASPAVRTRSDVEALLENVRARMPLRVVTPYASHGATIGLTLAALKSQAKLPTAGARDPVRPLFIADPESEALNFNCLARSRFLKLAPAPGAAVSSLLVTGLTAQTSAQEKPPLHRTQVHSAWTHFQRMYTLTPLVNWIGQRLLAVKSDVLSLPTPIVRNDLSTVSQALGLCPALVVDAREVRSPTTEFKMVGPHLLLHGEMFAPNGKADAARAALLSGIRAWKSMPVMQNIVLSFKVHDPQNILVDNDWGSRARQNLSELVEDLHQSVEALDGMLVAHNWDNWVLGMLDSGADVASFRITGPRRIDMPTRGHPPGVRPVPGLFLERALVEENVALVMAHYRKDGAFPTPDCVQPVEYWNLSGYVEQVLYTARVKCGVLVELGDHYKDAGLDKDVPLADSVRSLVASSRISQELRDLCPSA